MSLTLPALNIDLFLLVFMRMSGAILFNPMFGKTTVPNMVKAGISLLTAFLITATITGIKINSASPIELVVACISELAVGLGLGLIIDIVFSVVLLAGEMMDMQMGLGMANMFDPGSGISMPLFGRFFNIVLTLVFFAGDAHLVFLKLVSDSFSVIPPGSLMPTAESARFIVNLGGDMLELGLRMALPVLAVMIICDIAVGMIMKAVPQINIFSIEIQMKLVLGIIILIVSVPVLVAMSDNLVSFMLEKSTEFLKMLIPSS